MDKLVEQNKASKQINKAKKKPVKVVYISNPMKVNTSASQFRALVQELTGRDADDLPATTPFLQHSDAHLNQEQEQVARAEEEEVHKEDDELAVLPIAPHLDNGSDLLSLQDINEYFSPCNFWYESAFHVDASKV